MRTLAALLQVALLTPLYGLLLALAWLFKGPCRTTLTLALAAAAALAWQLSACTHPLRMGTFNIRKFGDAPTDMAKLTALVGSLDADVLAVQEIQSEPKLRDLAARLSRGGRTYRAALSKCGGTSAMQVGFLYDEHRVTLKSTREYPELDADGGGRCDAGERPGLLGVFTHDSRTLHLLTLHLTPGPGRSDFAKRKTQWQKAYAIARKLRADGAVDVVILGDVHSAGYLSDANGERTFLDGASRDAGMSIATSSLGCSEYWPERDGLYSPSLLDQAVVTPGLVESGSVQVHGYCEALRCAPHASSTPPDGFDSVSDHCPVTFDVAR